MAVARLCIEAQNQDNYPSVNHTDIWAQIKMPETSDRACAFHALSKVDSQRAGYVLAQSITVLEIFIGR